MALRGNLRDFTVTQLLNLVHLARKTGKLTITGSNEQADIFFRNGKLSYARTSKDDDGLAFVLYKTNVFSKAQYRAIAARAAKMTDKELGLLLINAGYVTQDVIINSLQQYFADIIRRLFTWAEGTFDFENDATPPADRITVKLDLENLIIEGARQLREMEQLMQEIPSLDIALRFTDRPGANLRNVNLSVEEWRVVSYVSPKNTLRQIARAANLSDLEIRRIVYGLLQAGLVEMVRPETAQKVIDRSKMFPTEDKDEQKHLVNRLIDRIRSL
jgi:hypothetical protein